MSIEVLSTRFAVIYKAKMPSDWIAVMTGISPAANANPCARMRFAVGVCRGGARWGDVGIQGHQKENAIRLDGVFFLVTRTGIEPMFPA